MNASPTAARYDPPTIILVLILVIPLIGLFAFTTVAGQSLSILLRAFGALTLLLFLFLFATNVRRLFDRRIILDLDGNGILDLRVLDRPVPWSLITDIREYRFRGTKCYLLALSHPVTVFVDNPYKRFLLTLNRPWLRNGFYVGAFGLTIGHEELGTAIVRFYGHEIVPYQSPI